MIRFHYKFSRIVKLVIVFIILCLWAMVTLKPDKLGTHRPIYTLLHQIMSIECPAGLQHLLPSVLETEVRQSG